MASTQNLPYPNPHDNPGLAVFDELFGHRSGSFADLFATPKTIERDIPEDESEEHDDTDWQDFLSYHAGVRL